MPSQTPIFIHSLFRAASTYFFHKFRGLGAQFTCYQEPFNEALVALNYPRHHHRLLAPPECSPLRHPPLDQPYFFEFWVRRAQLQGLFDAAFAYEEYFVPDSGALSRRQTAYVSALIEHANGRPVLQCCRSSGRAHALRKRFGGLHLHLWREPRIQWWSYKVANYFGSVSRRIYRAAYVPNALRSISQGTNIAERRVQYLAPHDNYLMFYGLWLDSWLRLEPLADININLDALTILSDERAKCARRISELIEYPLDLADARPAGMAFATEERQFYAEIEERVTAAFLLAGCSAQRIDNAARAARTARLLHECLPHCVSAERVGRESALAMMAQLAQQERANRKMALRRIWRSCMETLSGRGRAVRANLKVGRRDLADVGSTPAQPISRVVV